MIVTAQQQYEHTLRIIGKSHTISIEPEEWEAFARLAQLNWVKRKYAEFQINQKRIDDLRILISDPQTDPVIQSPIAPGSGIFPIPVLVNGQPHYFLMLNCAFRINYVGNECFTGTSDWLKAKPMRDDIELEIMEDPYNKPKDSRLYYKEVGNNVFLYTGTLSTGSQVRYSYLKYPPDILLLPAPVNCILPPHACQEITEEIARMIIELIESGRYQTYLIEQRLSAS